MGTSVISPTIFYWMDVLCNLDFVVNIVGIMLTAILPIRLWFYCIGMGDIDGSIVALSKKWLKANVIMIFVCLTITTFIPSEETMLTMLVADMITYENIELTKESAMALVDYIVEQVKDITG